MSPRDRVRRSPSSPAGAPSKKFAVIGAIVVVVGGGAIWFLTRPPKEVEKPKVEAPTGPSPEHLAKVAELVQKVGDLEQQGKFEEALAALQEVAPVRPGGSRT